MPEAKDIIGQKFNHITVLEYEIRYDEDVEQKICEIVSALQDNTVPSSEEEKV